MRHLRPASLIRHELETALAYREAYNGRPVDDPAVVEMRRANERDIDCLRRELEQATAAELEVTLSGPAYESNRVSVPFLTRVLERLQASYRALYRAFAPEGRVGRGEANLSLAATAGGSFKLLLHTAPHQLGLLEPPPADSAMSTIIDLLESAEAATAAEVAQEWAATNEDEVVRSIIRLASTLAGANGRIHLRWQGSLGGERLVTIRPERARDLAAALAGRTGREIIDVIGHLEMAQDQPPRVRIRTPEDEYLAKVSGTEMLDLVKELLFGEVKATLVIDMRTSPTTRSPGTDVELLDLQPT